jgi:hypothetical protein
MKLNRLLITTVLAGVIAPVYATSSSPSPFCIAVNGGFGNGGTSFVARNFTMPDASKCNPWTGYTKTGATVIFTTSGTACVSDDGNVLTVSVSSADPDYLGVGKTVSDYIRLCPQGVTSCPIGGGQDVGYETGAAEQQTCTKELLDLPVFHD